MRVKWIDTAKGIAMLCIIIGHMGGITIAGLNLNLVFAFHLPVFFVLSGYTLRKKEINQKYINDKFKRLMIPYFWTCFCVLVMDVINQCIVKDNASIQNITDVIATDFIRFFFASGTHKVFAGIELGTRIGAIWFLPATFFSIIIVQYVLNKFEKHYMRWLAIACIALFAYVSSEFIWFPFSVQSGAFATVLILTGYYIKEYDVLNKLGWKHYMAFGFVLVYAILTDNTKIYYVTNNFPDIAISLVVSVSSAFLILKLSMLCENNRYLSYVGKNSMYYLGTHLVALEGFWAYFEKAISILGVPETYEKWAMLVCHITFSTIVTWCILSIQNKLAEKPEKEIRVNGDRDDSIDVVKGILIVVMLIGHYGVDEKLRDIIYSFHMAAFVFLSGYFYKKRDNTVKAIIHTAKSFLIPYVVFCILDFILKTETWNMKTIVAKFLKYVFGISFSNKFLNSIASIGPVYFILLLFCVRVIYILIDNFVRKESHKVVAVVAVSFLGTLLGKCGLWLPWSLDCAMYAVIYYMIGYYCKKYEVLRFVKENLILYFVLATTWAYMIYRGSMEMASRTYNSYGLVILGAVSAIMLVYLLGSYIYDELPRWITRVFISLGKNTLYILIAHTLIRKFTNPFVGMIFDSDYIYYMVVNISIQLLVGVFVGMCVSSVKK